MVSFTTGLWGGIITFGVFHGVCVRCRAYVVRSRTAAVRTLHTQIVPTKCTEQTSDHPRVRFGNYGSLINTDSLCAF